MSDEPDDTGSGSEPGSGPKSEQGNPQIRSSSSSSQPGDRSNSFLSPDDFAAMSMDARTWHLYRKQVRVYKMIATVLGLDPDIIEFPWALQLELQGMLKNARDSKDEATRRRERRTTTVTNVIRYVLGGIVLAAVLKLIDFVGSSWPHLFLSSHK